jgi:hypothetical protein
VFTGLLVDKKPGEYPYLSMGDDTFAPGGSILRHGPPPYEHMGHEISFEELPEECRRLVLEVYRELWGLREGDLPRRYLSSSTETR